MLKILLFADTHLGFDYPIRPRIKRRRRGADFFSNYKRVLQFASDNQVDLLVHTGDFFFRSKIPQQIIDKAYEILLEFAKNDIPIVLVPGNHERSKFPISLLLNHKNINIFTQSKKFEFCLKGYKLFLAGFPYQKNNIRQEFPKLVGKILPQQNYDLKMLCLHQIVEGAKVGPADFTFSKAANVIKISDIPSVFDLILAGHIHKKQILWKNKSQKKIPIIYPGSTERTSFAEKDEVKGFFIMEFTKEKNNTNLNNLEFIELPTRTMIDLKVDLVTKRKDMLIEWLRKAIKGVDSNAIVRLEFTDRKTSTLLTAQERRSIFPKTMNVSLKKVFTNAKR